MSIRLVALCALVLLGSHVGQAQAQKIPYGGSELFRFALYKKGLKPIGESEVRNVSRFPQSTIIVIWGETATVSRLLNNRTLQNFVNNGGSILVLSDRNNRYTPGIGQEWGNAFGIEITGHTLRSARGMGYEGNDVKPFAKPRPRVNPKSPSPFDLTDGVEVGGETGIATDGPSEMTVYDAGFLQKVLAGYSDGTRRLDGEIFQARRNNFAVSLESQFSPGRVVVLADQQVFANGMMGFKKRPDDEDNYIYDNGNWQFADRTIEWLQGGYDEKRTQCLFIQDGQVIDKFAKELPQPPKPPVPNLPPEVLANWLLNFANTAIPWAEENNLFNRFLEQNLGFSRLVRMFLITVTIVFVYFGLRWLMRSGRKPEPTSTITKNVQEGMLPRGGVLRQRTAAQIEVGNLYEAARRRVRSRFDVLGARPNQDGKMPPLLTANDIPDGPLIHQTIRWLWLVGYGETPTGVSAGDWDRLNALLERMSARAARGDWSFGQEA